MLKIQSLDKMTKKHPIFSANCSLLLLYLLPKWILKTKIIIWQPSTKLEKGIIVVYQTHEVEKKPIASMLWDTEECQLWGSANQWAGTCKKELERYENVKRQ
jgi:hypothetical protein